MHDDLPPDLADALPFADNPDQRTACVLLLDTSSSMGHDAGEGSAIHALNSGITQFKQALLTDDFAARRVEVAVVTFGGQVDIHSGFQSAADFVPPTCIASGVTPMGEAICRALDLLEQQKQLYKQHGVPYTRPWVFLITDGAPTDNWHEAAIRVQDGIQHKHLEFFAVGVHGADMNILAQIVGPGGRKPAALDGIRFGDMFVWLSNSLKVVSQSQPGEQLALPNPGWTTVNS